MKRSRMALPLLGFAFLAVGAGFYGGEKTKAPVPVASVNVQSLGRQIEVVGDLGEPLEKLLTLRGEMVAADNFAHLRKSKVVPDPGLYVRVRHVNARQLEEPVVIELRHNWHQGKKPKPGTRLELIGYAKLAYVGDSPIEKQWAGDPRNRHDVPEPPEVARHVFEGHYEDQFVVLQFDELPAGE
ncbi:MAG: hypothetical protein SGJ19_14060 [Planctomycetia bacterium]|nr:hypothetical protein [Planctomycetia bacterium]